jgi:uncharacterized protein with NAD-binding domain and iron-sulfur cluster
MKRKVAIVGGGMAGLAAAFDLTRTKALQDHFDVTIYQLGWRLGGKAASGRLPDSRIIEHGLHVWFGCYENAFELVRATYKEWHPKPNQAITKLEQAFEPQRLTVVGSGARAAFFGLYWPKMDGRPGEGGPRLTLWPCVTQLLCVIEAQYRQLKPPPIFDPPALTIPDDIVVLLAEANVHIDGDLTRGPQRTFALQVNFENSLTASVDWGASFTQNPRLRTDKQQRGFVRYLRLISAHLWNDARFKAQTNGLFLQQLIDVGTALVKGVIIEMALGGASIAELDALDFREWLCGAGAHRDSVYGSSIVQSLYDTAFEYCGGDKRRPSFGAGCAAQTSMRLFGGYRDAFAYETVAGLGEVAVVPIYRVLRERGVNFQFFHKLTRVELNEARDGVAQIHFDRQVDLCVETYEPTIEPKAEFRNLEHWPECPQWDQIENGAAFMGLDLESYWCTQKTGEVKLSQGQHFDKVLLAVPVGSFKPLNDKWGPCAELIEANRRFKKMTDAASLVPTISVQAWCTPSLREMGWPPNGLPSQGMTDFPTSTGPTPLNIWADRTVVLNSEYWLDRPPPGSLQYLCDVLETSLYKEPPKRSGVPAAAKRAAHELAVGWFENSSRVLWPLASPNSMFDWNVLYDPQGRTGKDRLDYQIVKANIDPWACCTGSPAGSTRWRLGTDRSGFDHLLLAGSWIDTGFNIESIETAVMSGKQAARAIIGAGAVIDGEDFLHFDRGIGGWIREMVLGAEAAAETLLGSALGTGGPYARRASFRRRERGARK